jgi:hypothetical protein
MIIISKISRCAPVSTSDLIDACETAEEFDKVLDMLKANGYTFDKKKEAFLPPMSLT